MQRFSPKPILLRLGRGVKHYHLTLFTIFIAGVLAGVVLLVNNAILNPPEPDTPEVTTTPQRTPLSSLESFHASNELTEPPQAPAPNENPFGP